MHNAIRISLFLLLMPLLIFTTSCKKDKEEEIVDVRNEVVGTYTYLGGGVGIPYEMQIEVSKDNDNPENVNIFFKGMNYSFYANNLKRTAEGVSLEIPKQLTYFSGFPFVTEGQELLEVGGTTQQAFFFRNNKQLQLGLKATILNSKLEEQGSFGGLIKASRNE